MDEIWEDVVGWEGIYQVSSLGRVKRIKAGPSTFSGRILKPFSEKGYLLVSLYKNNKRSHYRIHRLVAIAFLGLPKEGQEINHKNGIKSFNWPENLEWVSPSENCLHAYWVLHSIVLASQVLDLQGEKNPNSKLRNKDIPLVQQLLREGKLSQEKIGKLFDVGRTTISAIKNGKSWAWLKAADNQVPQV